MAKIGENDCQLFPTSESKLSTADKMFRVATPAPRMFTISSKLGARQIHYKHIKIGANMWITYREWLETKSFYLWITSE